ncbi:MULTISPECIES: hypothetical protein [Marivita]|uniref:Uncharacterized protein n=1 Tax=Marivita cryptomonadis TaxID=505252 RepID=A0A9Q2NTQ8_9RHOB|nr:MULTISPECIES: hypothetical protein [Marivita]MCR9170078.1 hypothetical protein [Paracoccaceae bacterium]MBM2322678.1 hypothetical protein [Marivita cryptomonadis]MBM2332260.1 hypothetical protein [Marivita cryptomonadis]MBM2341844.1 hypothetical protein [Marivita cryptomonadis]MBM2346508.1 hypothetical protein [Marivita cryptomonadis]
MRRRYAPLGINIWGSSKFWALENDTHRLGYIYLLSSDHTTPIGVFRLPPSYAAEDRRMSTESVEDMIADLERCALVQTGPDHWIRVCRWFFEETGPHSPLNVTGFCNVFMDRKMAQSGRLRAFAFAEMAAATDQRSMAWDDSTSAYNKMIKALIEVCGTVAQTSFGDFTQALAGFGPARDGGLLHIVLDATSRKERLPILETANALAASIPEAPSKPLQSPIEAQTLKQTLKQTPSRTLTQTQTPRPGACELVKYPTTIDEHLAALNAKKEA